MGLFIGLFGIVVNSVILDYLLQGGDYSEGRSQDALRKEFIVVDFVVGTVTVRRVSFVDGMEWKI